MVEEIKNLESRSFLIGEAEEQIRALRKTVFHLEREVSIYDRVTALAFGDHKKPKTYEESPDIAHELRLEKIKIASEIGKLNS